MSAGNREFELIEWFRRTSAAHPRVPVGIGDDTAVITTSPTSDLLFAADMLMEGAHFTIPPATAEQIGWKALAVNLSDIAAMAGTPVAAVVSVALPRKLGGEFARRLHGGLHELAARFDVAIAGGDTNLWDGPLVVSVAVLGDAPKSGAVRRRGALPGDWILATGHFGGSLAERHLRFTPRVVEARQLSELATLHAMVDVSDGFAADLHHILDESAVAAVVFADGVPIHGDAVRDATACDALERALGDGEDFELLFTVSPEDGQRLMRSQPLAIPLAHVGIIEEGRGCRLQRADGTLEPLERRGWEHH